MISRIIKKLIGGSSRADPLTQQIQDMARETIAAVDLDDPHQRVGVQLYQTLRKQFEVIGKSDGEFPVVEPFASEKARGALLGTAIAVVRHEFGEAPQDAVLDAVITAFTLTFGLDGRAAAYQTLEESSAGNASVNFASDWAIRDAKTSLGDTSPASPMAYYLAVGDMI